MTEDVLNQTSAALAHQAGLQPDALAALERGAGMLPDRATRSRLASVLWMSADVVLERHTEAQQADRQRH
ncbi:MAG: hypothetical protein ACRDI2_15755 [Chloroflexota bacterium]